MSGLSSAYLQSLYQQQATKYCRVAPIAIWVLDSFLTLDGEIRLLTRTKRWGLTRVLYIPTRYFPIIGTTMAVYTALVDSDSEETCVALYWAAEIILYSGMAASEGLLLIRTLALWHLQSATRKLLMGTYVLVATVMFVCVMVSSGFKFKSICGGIDTSSVVVDRFSQVTIGTFASAALFELVVIVYTVLFALGSQATTGRYTASRLAAAVTHGNMLYAISLFATSIVNIIFVALPIAGDWHGIFINFQSILHGVLGSRILFDLQGALSEGISLQIFTNPETGMKFASVPLSGSSTNEF
ncbi:hypothetical protein EDD16DRAFT_1556448 [Pisolithus croceorrhizus]|nr:hypothetical protein F5141DRAFT_1204623 [Pisolithus sp. B1]KAI6111923.1 hypothetical protein EV401DRAFT_2198979 [Pisolithus croceorrhizus]KAI6125858.1 hypothetical protein EDD16DRAFT_1556448 [Pisolithus croceorrhizus]